MERVIVTGANGFVGAALCRELSHRNKEIIAVVRDESADISGIVGLQGLEIVYSDMSEYSALADKVGKRGFDALYHLAWDGSAGFLRGDASVQIKNVQYTCDIAKACRELNCKRMIFAASIMEYEINAIMETDSIPGINSLYCSAKVAADYMARAVAGALGIEYIRAVISNIYGPGEHSPRLINSSLRKLLKGEHCAFSEGKQVYDFIYVTDAVKALIALGEKGVSNRTYYIGSLNPRPLRDFLIEMKDCIDESIRIGLGELPFNGPALTYTEFDINAVRNDTGFAPEVTFSDGIKNTIMWLKETMGDE